MKQIDLFSAPKNQSTSKFVSIYRVSLVKDKSISFGQPEKQKAVCGAVSLTSGFHEKA